MQANPAAIGQCAAAHIPGREALALSHQQLLVKSTRIAARSLALQWKGGVLAVFPQLSPGIEGTPARWNSRELWGCSRFPLPFCMVTGNICIALKRAAAPLLDGPDQYCAARLESLTPYICAHATHFLGNRGCLFSHPQDRGCDIAIAPKVLQMTSYSTDNGCKNGTKLLAGAGRRSQLCGPRTLHASWLWTAC
jgi:hypothetical protein